MTLTELRNKYHLGEGAVHEPKPDCKFCGGSGERTINKLNKTMFCICLYVSHDFSDLAGDTLSETVKKLRKEMGNDA